MRHLVRATCLMLGLVTCAFPNAEAAPVAKPTNPSDDIQVSDPYRWLEQDSPARLNWIREQNNYSKSYLKNRKSRVWMEDFIRKALDKASTISKISLGDVLFTLESEGLGKPTKFIKKSADGTTKVLFSTFEEKPNGSMAVMDIAQSPDGKYVTIATVSSGTIDSHTLFVFSLPSGDRVDRIDGSVYSRPSWLNGDEFTYMSRIKNAELTFRHKIGSQASDDGLYSKGESFVYNVMINDEPWLFIYDSTSIRFRKFSSDVWYQTTVSASEPVAVIGDELYFTSRGEKGTGQLEKMRLDATKVIDRSTVVIPEGPMELRSAELSDNHFVLIYRMAANNKIVVADPAGKTVHTLVTPSCCYVDGAWYYQAGDQLWISMFSQVKSMTMTYDFQTKSYKEGNPADVLLDVDGVGYVSEVVMATSANSAQVPVRITYKKGLAFNGQSPAIIEGYGGFGSSGNFDPSPRKMILEFMSRGGVYIGPALRGGNELGEPWHKGGKGFKKQNVFNDLIAAAEYVIDRGITSPAHLAVMGQSNGGLLVSAVATQRPDLFRLAIPIAGVHDMLRKERLDPLFDEGWSFEYGSTDNVEDFKNLQKYSPLHNLKKQEYPTFLIVVGERDSRVNPAHSYKFTAALQEAQTGPSPVLMASFKNSGHWLNSSQLQGWISWRVLVSMWSTIFDELGVNMENTSAPATSPAQ